VKLLIHYAEFQWPQELESIRQDLGPDSQPRAKQVHEVEEKMKNPRKTDCCLVNRFGRQKRSLRKALIELWQDAQAEPEWKYERVSPVQLLEKSELHSCSKDNNELVRATWFWSRRPRFLAAASSILWVTVALGLPFWLFVVPSIGVPLIIAAAVIVNIELVRSTRWRRQYEFSIARLIRHVAVHDSGGPSRSNP
jgi:hypothetical protein